MIHRQGETQTRANGGIRFLLQSCEIGQKRCASRAGGGAVATAMVARVRAKLLPKRWSGGSLHKLGEELGCGAFLRTVLKVEAAGAEAIRRRQQAM